MSSGKVVAMVLEAEGAIAKWRETMGEPILRRLRLARFARNSARASSSTARMDRTRPKLRLFEIGYFFAGMELI